MCIRDSLDGLSEQLAVDEVLVGGDVFRDFACNTAQSGAQGLGSMVGTMSMSGQQYNSSNKHDHKGIEPVSYTHLRAHETVLDLVCRLLLEKKKKQRKKYFLLAVF